MTLSATLTLPYLSTRSRLFIYNYPLTLLPLRRITKVYESETYDYPSAIQESISELSTSIGYGITNFAATNLKGTSLPAPAPVTAPQAQHKTLPHALGRAATQAATGLQESGAHGDDKFGKALGLYAGVWNKIASARVEHDDAVKHGFLAPWQVCDTSNPFLRVLGL